MTSGTGQAFDAFFAALLDDDADRLYDQAPCGYLSTTPEGTIVKANQTFLTLVGYQREEIIGRVRFAELLSPGGRIYHETHYAPMLRMGGAREIALDLLRRDGTRMPVLVNAVLERDPDGRPLVIRTAVFDATHRREYERELLRAKERAEASEAQARALARTLQQTLIPPSPPAIPALDLAAQYRPAGDGAEVGGDFYDVFPVGDDEWVVAIGDVCGKGAEAAVVTALVRYTLREASVQCAQPSEALSRLNAALLRQQSERFCTVSLLRLRRVGTAWQGLLSLGGHPPPLLRRTDGALHSVGDPGTVLGVLDRPDLYDAPVSLGSGESLVLFTDGLSEGRNGDQFYGEQRIASAVAACDGSAAALSTSLLADVLAFQGGTARDDIAIVVLRVPGEPPRATGGRTAGS
jgi:sigma-B regulation protein RsbU (phosphoserine phosphatase)